MLYVYRWLSSSPESENGKGEVQAISLNGTHPETSSIQRMNVSTSEVITSLAVDWVSGKLYLGISVSTIQNYYGRIEVCSFGNDSQCTVVLSSIADSSAPKVEGIHLLVLNPVDG